MKQIALFFSILCIGLMAGHAASGKTIADEEPPGYKISFKIDGMTDEYAYLGYHLGEKKYVEDTAAVVNGTATFEGDYQLIPGIYFLYTPGGIFMELVVSDQHFSIEANSADLLNSKKVSDSEDNILFSRFQQQMAAFQQESAQLRAQFAEAGTAADSSDLQLKIKEVNEQNVDFQQRLIKDNPNSFTAQILQIMARPTGITAPEGMDDAAARSYRFYKYRDQFWDGVDFSNEGILRTPVFEPKLAEYMDQLVVQHPDSINEAIDDLLGRTKDVEATFRFILVTMTNKYQSSQIMGMDAVFVHLAENYYISGKATWANEEMVSKFKEAVTDIKPNLLGRVAPTLNLIDTAKAPVTLVGAAKEYTIIFFYDPNCSHCKKETPKMLSTWHELEKEIDVACMGVSIGKDMDEWKDFVKTYNCDWVNAGDPFITSNFRRLYNIRSTPTIYVLDSDRRILGKRLSVDQLADFIRDHKKLKDKG